ncbi:DNA-binding protein [Halorientalis sp. IM1011]|uniref:response regulator n=1 Tax=Halorientalis sp. IM1011 TaxID=1932360 RepID=UPI00097CC5F9|nr:response regulator [Halorientalis sp. IM1011]AQL43406.1 DNA-binding protein [Halorientalis sp. IM1011]
MSTGDLPTVLVVDDEPDVADAYAAQLEQEYHVRTAYSGEEALEALGPEIDIVLLDRRMPDVSGDDVLAEIREAGYDCRVAMVTAVDPDFDIIDMPFDDYIIKPVSREDLFDTIDRLLVCAEYEEKLQRYYSLTSKYATLLANKSNTELENSDEFEDLRVERDRIRQDLQDTVARFDDEAFAAVFRELHEGPPPVTEE